MIALAEAYAAGGGIDPDLRLRRYAALDDIAYLGGPCPRAEDGTTAIHRRTGENTGSRPWIAVPACLIRDGDVPALMQLLRRGGWPEPEAAIGPASLAALRVQLFAEQSAYRCHGRPRARK